MARDRKRAKQRRGRGAAVARRSTAQRPESSSNGHPGEAEEAAERMRSPGVVERADLPGALEHAGAEVDEFDAALVRGAGGVPADSATEQEEPDSEVADALQEPSGPGGGGVVGRGGSGGGPGGGGGGAAPSGAPLRGGNRAIGFLAASWAELQRVQWPDRRQVTQATTVVLGFVVIAGIYLGVADEVAKEIVEFIL